jgi:multisubunit Na+/H+ antiporter MnhB subunit
MRRRGVVSNDLFIAVVAVAAGVGAALLVLGSDREPSPKAASAALALVVGLAYVGSGLVGRRQRPENRLGAVMVFIGFAWFVTFLADANESLVFTLGTALEDIYLLGFVYLVLSFPSGRLRSKLDLGLAAAAVAIGTLVELAWLLFADSRSQICSDCPQNALEITRNDGLANGILQGQRTAGVVLSVFTVAYLVRRWRRASGLTQYCATARTSYFVGSRVWLKVQASCTGRCSIAHSAMRCLRPSCGVAGSKANAEKWSHRTRERFEKPGAWSVPTLSRNRKRRLRTASSISAKISSLSCTGRLRLERTLTARSKTSSRKRQISPPCLAPWDRSSM